MLDTDLRQAMRATNCGWLSAQQEIQSVKITGFEALLRWKIHTREIHRGFSSDAEETGAILRIGDWVLRTACREAASWTQPLRSLSRLCGATLQRQFVRNCTRFCSSSACHQSFGVEITRPRCARFSIGAGHLRRSRRSALHCHGTISDWYSHLSILRAFPFTGSDHGSFIKSVNSNGQAATIVRAVLGLVADLACLCREGVREP